MLQAVEELCCGNEQAMQFCTTFREWCHWIDDLVDQDKEWNSAEAVRLNLSAMVVFSENEFFQKHRQTITPLVMQAVRAWADSTQWERRTSRRDRRAADVLKSYYHEVFWHCAYLTAVEVGRDGWEHLTAMTAKHRKFDYDYRG